VADRSAASQAVAPEGTSETRHGIRRAVPADAAAIASISVRAWQVAYRGLLPDAYLDGLSVAERRSAWHHYLVRELTGYRMWVLEDEARVIGFTRTGPCFDAGIEPHTGQIFGLYVDPDRLAEGFGRRLLGHGLEDLRNRGYRHAIVWAFAGNDRAARLFASVGSRPDGATRAFHALDDEVTELRYRIHL
jgi:ribosomal protein S18 acetylase RimI-like enzyme